ncbi:MAG: TRL-like family protein [Bdellovibrionaceae bacterium]|nr:TRL-like family protein [Pseudobdellovibrionaceae bacterium]
MINTKSILLLSFCAFASSLIGCASGSPVNGALYSDVLGPVAATNAIKGNLKGESCAASYLGLVALGDASINTAAKAAGINQISHIDHTWSNILGLYSQYCTIVWGSRGGPMIPAKVPAPAAPTQLAPQPTNNSL